jgi:glyoxylate reductase
MRPKVYITRWIPSPGPEMMGKACDVLIHEGEEPAPYEEIMANARDKDGMVCLPGDRIDKGVMEAGVNLKVISTISVGFEHIDVAGATARGIYVGYVPGVLTEATADLAFALLLAVSRRITEAERFLRDLRWNYFSLGLLHGRDVWGRTVGIIGLGRIGKAMARRSKGFNMRVFYTDALRISPEEEKELGVEYRSLEDLLKESDFVSLHTPLTKETYHLIDEKHLRMMKADAILINTSRGPTVDEAALVKALTEGWIGGAGLDVFDPEPIRKESPLLHLENVVLVPHIGSATKESRRRMAEIAANNLVSVLKGEPPLHWLNPEVEKVRPLSRVRMI